MSDRERQLVEQTSEDREFLQADGTTPEDKKVTSPKMVEVVHLLQANLAKTTRLMLCQLLFIGGPGFRPGPGRPGYFAGSSP